MSMAWIILAFIAGFVCGGLMIISRWKAECESGFTTIGSKAWSTTEIKKDNPCRQ